MSKKSRKFLTKKELDEMCFPYIYEHRDIYIDRNVARCTYILQFEGRYYKFEINVCVNYVDDKGYIFDYHIDEKKNEVIEVVPREVKTIVWDEV